jgi:mannose/fructose-specific phosphotransferase system component IIA
MVPRMSVADSTRKPDRFEIANDELREVVFTLDILTRGALGLREVIFHLDVVAGTPGRAAISCAKWFPTSMVWPSTDS